MEMKCLICNYHVFNLNDQKNAFLTDVVTRAHNSIIWKAEAKDKEFKPTLDYIVNSRLA